MGGKGGMRERKGGEGWERKGGEGGGRERTGWKGKEGEAKGQPTDSRH